MKSQIKHHLNLLLEELEKRQESEQKEIYNGENPFLTTEAAGVGQFIKKIALEIKDYELVGLAEAVYQKAKEIDDENATIYEECRDSMMKEFLDN